MKRLCGTFLMAVSVWLLCATPSPCAEIFRWVDDRGVVYFTDNLHNIPAKFRAKATRVETRAEPPASPTPVSRISVPFQKRGELMIVQATLNERAAAMLILDTGASYTTISQTIAKQLGIDLEKNHPTLPFQTANGVIQAPLVNVDSIELGGLRLKDLTVAVHEVFPDPGIAGLLGLNFLSQFRVDIDSKNSVLYLERK